MCPAGSCVGRLGLQHVALIWAAGEAWLKDEDGEFRGYSSALFLV